MKFLFLLVQIVAIATSGLFVNYFIQHSITNREQKFEIYVRNLNEAEKALQNISDIVNKRIFQLQRVFWAFQHGDDENAAKDWESYRETIDEWNIKDMSYAIKFKTYYDSQLADSFFRNGSSNVGKTASLYHYFYIAHRAVLDWKSCLKKVCGRESKKNVCKTTECDGHLEKTRVSLDRLNSKAEQLIAKTTEYYATKYLHKQAG